MSQALYRTYRSKTLDEVVGQEPVTTALKNALKSGKLSHAYLFTGPRGVGKTSIARILAFEINNIPYDSDNLPIDIIEIDAASNRRIDEIRDLRDKVRIAPVSAPYKVYIIDEVHMLTREAFNALLKTLEEPPAHVIFILATTESHKLPETIVSRTQRYNFKLIDAKDVAAHLKTIAATEQIDITDEALELIARHSGGSLRDALSLLDQIRNTGGHIDAKEVQSAIGLPTSDYITNLLKVLAHGTPKEVIEQCREASDNGISPVLLAQSLSDELREQLADTKPVLDLQTSLALLQELLSVESSLSPDTALQVALLGVLAANKAPMSAAKSQTITETGPPLTLSKPVAAAKRDIAEHEAKIAKAEKKAHAEAIAPPKVEPVAPITLDEAVWQLMLEKLKETHSTLHSVVSNAQADLSKAATGQMSLNFKFPFHQKRINEARNKQVLLDKLAALGVTGVEILCEMQQKLKPEPTQEVALEPITVNEVPKRDEVWLDQIKTVFGGAEVLE